MRNDWLDYPLSVFKNGINSAAGSVFLATVAVSFATSTAYHQQFYPENFEQVLDGILRDLLPCMFWGGTLLLGSVLFPLCWPFLVGFFVGFIKLLRFDGHPFWMFWLMTACQFFLVVIEAWRLGDSRIGWKSLGIGLLVLGIPFLATLGLFYALARRRRKRDQSANA